MFDTKERDIWVHEFSMDTSAYELPEVFAYPHYYKPHDLALAASRELQDYLENQKDFEHNFGLDSNQEGLIIGKMFGVLVIQDGNGQLGYLAGFSGKLAESNFLAGFVPPIYDTLDLDGFYKIGEERLNQLTSEIVALEQSKDLAIAKENLLNKQQKYEEELSALKKIAKEKKNERKHIRSEQKAVLTASAYDELCEELKNQSLYYHFRLRDLKQDWEDKIEVAQSAFQILFDEIERLKEKRKQLSHELQKQIHQQYRFLNAREEIKNLVDLFQDGYMGIPPAGSGECAAPKLFQYAYEHQLTPVCMAEFWWGQPPKSEVRVHGDFYPACRGKCEPILKHMLQGLSLEPNPLLKQGRHIEKLEVLYEDDYIVAINKPYEFLSVPGRNIKDSVLARLRKMYPDAKGALLLHRLDMSTSGVLLAAKYEDVHRFIQRQFIQRKVKKRYVALLEGHLSSLTGDIKLPIRVDLNNRPCQLVCYEHGKQAETHYQVDGYIGEQTRIYFYPKSGRTHQLRVHAAHRDGLGVPIVGDDLYGHKGDRLMLHAESLTFIHPKSREELTIVAESPF